MADSENPKPPNQAVLDAMMDDLGVGRRELFFVDDKPSAKAKDTKAAPAQPGQPIKPPRTLEAAAWVEAATNGSLGSGDNGTDTNGGSDGQAHRMNRTGNEVALRSRFANHSGHSQNTDPTRKRQYDPLHPSFSSRTARRGRRGRGSRNGGYSESPLGGLVPPGGEVRRWAKATASAQSSLTQSAVAVTTGQAGVSRSSQKALQQPSTGRSQVSPAPRAVSKDLIRVASQPVARSPLRNVTNMSDSAVQSPSTSGATIQSNETKEDKPLLPHQRRDPGYPQLVVKLLENQDKPSNGSLTQDPAPATPAHAIFEQKGLRIIPVTQEDATHQGQVALYERAQEVTVYWELSFEDREAMSGDVRFCLSPMNMGSVVLLRRRDQRPSNNLCVLSSQISFPDIDSAKNFCEELKHCMMRLANKGEKYTYPGKKSQQKVQDTKPKTEEDTAVGVLIDIGEEVTTPKHSSPEPLSPKHTDEPRPYYDDLKELNHHVASTDNSFFDVTPTDSEVRAIESIPVGENLSQNSLRLLSGLPYDRMIMGYSHLVGQSTQMASRQAALKVALTNLVSEKDYQDLQQDEKDKVVAVVYATILHGHTRVVRTAEGMITLQSSARDCPAEIRKICQSIPRTSPDKIDIRSHTIAPSRAFVAWKDTQIRKQAPIEETKPAAIEEPKLTPIGEPKPAPVEEPKPAPTEETKPAAIGELKPIPTEELKPAPIREPKPAKTKEEKEAQQKADKEFLDKWMAEYFASKDTAVSGVTKQLSNLNITNSPR